MLHTVYQWHVQDAGNQHGGIGKRRNLVSKKGAHADGSRSGGQRHAQALCHAHESHAHSS